MSKSNGSKNLGIVPLHTLLYANTVLLLVFLIGFTLFFYTSTDNIIKESQKGIENLEKTTASFATFSKEVEQILSADLLQVFFLIEQLHDFRELRNSFTQAFANGKFTDQEKVESQLEAIKQKMKSQEKYWQRDNTRPFFEKLDKMVEKFEKNILKATIVSTSAHVLALINENNQTFSQYVDVNKDIMSKLKKNDAAIINEKITLLNQFNNKAAAITSQARNENKLLDSFRNTGLVAALILFILASLIQGSLIYGLSKRLRVLKELTVNMSRGDLFFPKISYPKDVFGAIFDETKNLFNNMTKRAEIADKISEGDLTVEVDILSSNDRLGYALEAMLVSLKTKEELANKIASGSLDVKVNHVSENDALGKSLEKMLSSLKTKSKMINDSFKALHSQHLKTKEILESIDEGLVVVDSDLRIASDYSRATKDILGVSSISGERIDDLFFPVENISKDNQKKRNEFFEVISCAFELFIPSQFNELVDNFPKNFDYFRDGPENPPIKIAFNLVPIISANDEMDHILVTFTDITRLEELEDNVGYTNRSILEAVGQLRDTMSNPKDFAALDMSVRELLPLAQQVTTQLKTLSRSNVRDIFRKVHTIKGGVRTFEIDYLNNFAHEAETLLTYFSDNDEALDSSDLQGLNQKARYLLEGLKSLHDLCDLLIEGNQGEFHLPEKKWQAFLFKLERSISSIAENLGKKVQVEIKSDWVLQNDDFRMTNIILTHLLRNAVDHGIELPIERQAEGKDAAGHISVSIEVKNSMVYLKVFDDGQGIRIEKLKERVPDAPSNGEFSSESIIKIISADSFSTKDSVSFLSGRGIGMNAVKQSVEELSGYLKLIKTGKQGTVFEVSWPLQSEALAIESSPRKAS